MQPPVRALVSVLAAVLLSASGWVAAPAAATLTYLCSGYRGCADAGMPSSGYAQANATMYWRMYAGHNCTNYAAYRMVRSGLPDIRPWSGSGNATYWGSSMPSITDGVPAVGAVAWWRANVSPAGSAGHVAYVERVVSRDEIIVSQDSWGGDFSWARITRTSRGWPTGFIHFHDVPLLNTSRPVVTGTPKVGGTLLASSGTWSPGGVSTTYQWQADGVDIPGAAAPTLTVTDALLGSRLAVRVRASEPGYAPAVAASTPTRAVLPGAMRATAPPALAGETRVGAVLQVSSGAWSPAPQSLTYQWRADGAPIPGATGPSLDLEPALLNRAVSVTVTAHRAGYRNVRWTSPATPVAPGTLSLATQPQLSGLPRLGETLQVAAAGSVPESSVSVQWLRAGRPVPRATGPTYRVTAADLGSRLAARVQYTRPGFTTLAARTTSSARAKSTPTIRVGLRRAHGLLAVTARVAADSVQSVDGVLRVRSRGRLLAEVPVHDGTASTTLGGLSAGARTLRVVLRATDTVARGVVERRVTIS